MGTDGMSFSLQSRDLIADSIETASAPVCSVRACLAYTRSSAPRISIVCMAYLRLNEPWPCRLFVRLYVFGYRFYC